MKENKVKFLFSYELNDQKYVFKEKIGCRTGYIKLFDLIREFKKFAVACGFSSNIVNKIIYKDIPEYEKDSIVV